VDARHAAAARSKLEQETEDAATDTTEYTDSMTE
jgi:hypothetical protein